MDNEKEEILRMLIENYGKKFSIRSISIIRKINYKSAYNSIRALEKEEAVNLERFGNTLNCLFSKKFSPLIFKVEYERRKELLKNKNFRIIYDRLNELTSPLVVLIFGSFAKNEQKKNSDIDLLVITESSQEVERAISLMPINIHPTIISWKEFFGMVKRNEFNVVSEALRKNIILLGIEEYYRLLEAVQNA